MLDTHVFIRWLLGSKKLSRSHARLLNKAHAGAPVFISDISLWETATLVSLGRLEFDLPLREWLEASIASPAIERQAITPSIAAEVASLPDHFHRDPADRLIVATARVLRATLLTEDELIIDSKIVATI